MSSSSRPLISEYIADFAKKSVFDYTWYYSDLYYKSIFTTLLFLKNSNRFSVNYLSTCDNILTTNSNFLMLLSLRFSRKIYEAEVTDIIVLNTDPLGNPFLANIFNDVFQTLINDMGKSLGIESAERIKIIVSPIMTALSVYCWQFIKNAKQRGLLAKVVEELYLLREIEVFKNRKGE
jgi:hypothetical protein